MGFLFWRPLFVVLVAMAGCAAALETTPRPSAVALLLDEKIDHLGTIDTSRFADVPGVFTASELRLFHEHIGDVEQVVNTHLRQGSVGAAWIAGYFRIESSLPLLRQGLLTDFYFYGWEGPDYNQEWAYLDDEQYPHSLAYIAAIEAVTGQPLRESVQLTPAELGSLKAEADVDFAKRDPDPDRLQRGLFAKWLLQKLDPEYTKRR